MQRIRNITATAPLSTANRSCFLQPQHAGDFLGQTNPRFAVSVDDARVGRRLDLLDPTPVDIEIEDIAHGLAFVARWNGQTRGDWPYSVAEHSLLVEEIYSRTTPAAPPRWKLAALLHDAPEYVIGDMISPVKAAVGPGYGALDDRLAAAVHLACPPKSQQRSRRPSRRPTNCPPG